MSSGEGFRRVTKDAPCPVCGKTDWCVRNADGSAAICPRVADGSTKMIEGSGWLHVLDPALNSSRLGNMPTVRLKPQERYTPNEISKMWQELSSASSCANTLCTSLGVSFYAMEQIGIAWHRERQAWAFPMQDAMGHVIGIRLRLPSGKKFAVRGSKNGLFIPHNLEHGRRLYVVEGESDTAAGIDLGLPIVGRPGCLGGTAHLVRMLQWRWGRLADRPRVFVIADSDKPGVEGANRLAKQLQRFAPSCTVLIPPAKDLRAWVQQGATKADVERLI